MKDETCTVCDHEYDLHYLTFGGDVGGCADTDDGDMFKLAERRLPWYEKEG